MKNQDNLLKMTEQRKLSSKEQRKRFAFMLILTEVNALNKFKEICRITARVLKKKPCKCNNHQIFDNTKITAQ